MRERERVSFGAMAFLPRDLDEGYVLTEGNICSVIHNY
jgi:hypothetical protein